MTAIICKTIDRTYANNGQHSQQMLDYTLTGQIRKADHLKWDKGSDIPEYAMSVKSARFTLATDLIGETLEDKVEDAVDAVEAFVESKIEKVEDAIENMVDSFRKDDDETNG